MSAETDTPPASSSRSLATDAIAARVAASTRNISAEVQERANQEEKRQLRRIIYSGIERNNDAKLALEAIKVLQKLIKNILDHPGEEKYTQFKTTNATIQRTLINSKNTLEYAIAVGFRADIQNFQPFYVLKPTPKNLQSLQNGLECLDEFIAREEAKAANAKTHKETLKEVQERQKNLVKLAYDDDRREKQMRDAMEKERRDALIEARARAASNPPAAAEPQVQAQATDDEEGDEPPPYGMPGGGTFSTMPLTGGRTLSGASPPIPPVAPAAPQPSIEVDEEDEDEDEEEDEDEDEEEEDEETTHPPR